MTTLITGASGVLGLHVAREVAAEGADVIAVSTSGAPVAADLVLGNMSDKVKFFSVDIRDFEGMLALAQRHGVTHVVHAAAMTGEAQARAKPAEVFDVNVHGTMNILEVARKVRAHRLIYVGSSAEYGTPRDAQPITEDQIQIQGMYAETKYAGHRMAMRYHQTFGLDIVTARVSSVYGPNTRFNPHRGLVGNTLLAFLSREIAFGRPVSIGRENDYARAWTYAADSALGIAMLLRASQLNHMVYNVAADSLHRLNDVVHALKEAVPGAQIDICDVAGLAHVQDAERGILDVRRASQDIGFKPRFSLEAGLRAYIAWWRELGEARAANFSR